MYSFPPTPPSSSNDSDFNDPYADTSSNLSSPGQSTSSKSSWDSEKVDVSQDIRDMKDLFLRSMGRGSARCPSSPSPLRKFTKSTALVPAPSISDSLDESDDFSQDIRDIKALYLRNLAEKCYHSSVGSDVRKRKVSGSSPTVLQPSPNPKRQRCSPSPEPLSPQRIPTPVGEEPTSLEWRLDVSAKLARARPDLVRLDYRAHRNHLLVMQRKERMELNNRALYSSLRPTGRN